MATAPKPPVAFDYIKELDALVTRAAKYLHQTETDFGSLKTCKQTIAESMCEHLAEFYAVE